LFNADSDASRELAENYASLRGVPGGQIIGLSFPLREKITRKEYGVAADAVRRILRDRPWGERIRCLVTFYDVPLKVAGPKPTEQQRGQALTLKELRLQAIDRLGKLVESLEADSGLHEEHAAREEHAAGEKPVDLEVLMKRYVRSRDLRIAQIEKLSGELRGKETQKAINTIELVEGREAVIPVIRAGLKEPTPAMREQLDTWSDQARQMERELAIAFDEGPMSPRCREVLKLVRTWRGLRGLCAWCDEQISWLEGRESNAAFDSELSLVLWDRYRLYRWQINPLNPQAKPQLRGIDYGKTLMVARIDAPTPAIAARMVEDAVATETDGLGGKFYIDARGLKGADLFTEYDRDLLDLYYLVKDHTDIPAVLDVKPEVFSAGSCPDAGLYCGWYSLSNYVPAFTFVRGAVGYHIASFELRSLRDTEKKYWCPGLLQGGMTATFGPTAEPYLHSFPKPSRFFGLLLTGELTLVECFYESKPLNSWQQALLGDPLYRPFAHRPKLSRAELETFLGGREKTGLGG